MTEKTFLVREYMHETVSLNPEGKTLKDVVELMATTKRNGVFIVDQDQHVQGIVSAWDIIEHVVPDYLESDKHLAPFENDGVLVERVLALQNSPIEEFMTNKVHVVQESSSIMEVATMLSEFRIRQLPVVNADNVLVGCINRTDVKLIIAEILNIQTT
ncbi:CBS domain-containing protein [Candidatus Uhrbacteria bacterium]|nr:CBS domain-containing protein [Candidatus Uhrbacteria bacterium]